MVAPHWGAWIEIPPPHCGYAFVRPSHPTGVRGLKYADHIGQRGPCAVAPHWGAWIEMAAIW